MKTKGEVEMAQSLDSIPGFGGPAVTGRISLHKDAADAGMSEEVSIKSCLKCFSKLPTCIR
jgi:hypothetical protein